MTLSLPMGRRSTKCLVPGAVAIYLFNEGTGTALTDRSGNGYHGTFAGGEAAPTWTQYGLSFDGGDRVILPAIGAGLSGGFSVTVIHRPGADVTTTQGIIGLDLGKVGALAVISGKYLLYAPDATAGHYMYSTAAAVAANTWQSVTVNVTYSGAIEIYIGTTRNAVGTTTGTWTTPEADRTTIGTRDATTSPYIGDIAALLVYPSPRPAAQIAQNHAALKGMLAARGIALA